MKAKQLYFVLLAVFILLLAGFFGVAYGANKLMGGQATKLSKLRADNETLGTLEVGLAKNKQDIVKYSDLNTIAETIVPQDKDQAEAVREIVNLASKSGISKLSSINFPSSDLGNLTPGANAKANLTQLLPVKGITGVYDLQIIITQSSSDEVSYDKFISFLTRLEQNRRTAQVSGITVQPDITNPNLVAFTLVINEFIKP